MWSKTLSLVAWTTFLVAPLAPLSPLFTGEQALKDSDHKKLGKEVAAYFEARVEAKGISEAFADLQEQVQKIEKKLKGPSALGLVEDWERIFFYAQLGRYKDKVKKGKLEERSIELPNGELPFVVYTPSKYRSKDGPYPLVLSIPPAGTEPEEHFEASWTEGARDSSIVMVPSMPADAALFGELGSSDEPGGISHAMWTFGEAAQSFAIDMNRIFLVGHGEGADTALETAAGYPHRFAGVVVLGDLQADHDATNFRHVNVLLVGGGPKAEAFERNATELEYTSVVRNDEASEADIWAWMGETARVPYPADLVFSPRDARMKSASWLSVEGIDLDQSPRVEATADRSANTITIEANSVSSVMVLFNDSLIDMDRPVKVVINGIVNEAALRRNQRSMLDLAWSQGDWGRVFTNFQVYDVPTRQ